MCRILFLICPLRKPHIQCGLASVVLLVGVQGDTDGDRNDTDVDADADVM